LVAGIVIAQVMHAGAQSPVPGPNAGVLINTAKVTAHEEQKNILVEFSASWCGWCQRFEAFVHSAELGPLIGRHFVLVKLIVQESPDKRALNTLGAQELMDEWGGARSGLPFYAFLNAQGEKIASSNAMPTGGNIGYPATSAEIEAFLKLLEQTAPRMSSDDRMRIAEYFKSK
jgi:uncharacterized protein YyaL (SSP411 family)